MVSRLLLGGNRQSTFSHLRMLHNGSAPSFQVGCGSSILLIRSIGYNGIEMSAVAVYNQGGTELLMTVSLKKAMTMLHRGVVTVHTPTDRNAGPYIIPKAVQLVKYIFAKWMYNRKHKSYSREAILERDRYTCAYCLGSATTVDHIIPRCQDGKSTWLNAVASCQKCNLKKGGRTPEEANMKLLFKPHMP